MPLADDTLSKDWGTQGISTTPGFIADLSYFYINQNQQRIGTGKASQSQINALAAAGQEIEDYTTTRITTAALTYISDDLGPDCQPAVCSADAWHIWCRRISRNDQLPHFLRQQHRRCQPYRQIHRFF